MILFSKLNKEYVMTESKKICSTNLVLQFATREAAKFVRAPKCVRDGKVKRYAKS